MHEYNEGLIAIGFPIDKLIILNNYFCFRQLRRCVFKLQKEFETVQEFIMYLLFYTRVSLDDVINMEKWVNFHHERLRLFYNKNPNVMTKSMVDNTYIEKQLHDDVFYYTCFLLVAYIPGFHALCKEYGDTLDVSFYYMIHINPDSLIEKWQKTHKKRVEFEYRTKTKWFNWCVLFVIQNKLNNNTDLLVCFQKHNFSKFQSVVESTKKEKERERNQCIISSKIIYTFIFNILVLVYQLLVHMDKVK
jgi:hypothetical protein